MLLSLILVELKNQSLHYYFYLICFYHYRNNILRCIMQPKEGLPKLWILSFMLDQSSHLAAWWVCSLGIHRATNLSLDWILNLTFLNYVKVQTSVVVSLIDVEFHLVNIDFVPKNCLINWSFSSCEKWTLEVFAMSVYFIIDISIIKKLKNKRIYKAESICGAHFN